MSMPEWTSAVLGQINAGNNTPTNTFQAQTAGAGTGTNQLNEQDYLSSLVNPGIASQQGTQANQAALLAQYQAQANGTGGPDIAQQELQNATQKNNQAVASQVASQRGVDPALAARMAIGAGAANSQAEAGQAATLRLQQMQGAQNAEAGLLGQQQQGNLSEIGTGISGQQAENSTNLQNLMGQQSLAQATGTTNAELQSAAQAQNKGLAGYGAAAAGGALQGAGAFGAAAANGMAGQQTAGAANDAQGQALINSNNAELSGANDAPPPEAAAHGAEIDHLSRFMLSPGEKVVHGDQVSTVPGRAHVAGDSYRNDTKPAQLTTGDIVIPREVSEDTRPEVTHAFVQAMREHRKMCMGGAA